MFPIGGVGAMLAACAAALLPAALVALARRRHGWLVAVATAGFWWSLAVIAAVTLLPMYVRTGYIPLDEAQTSCSWDIGGPAPEGFWIFGGTQRMLNTLVFVPSGALLVLAVAHRPRRAVAWVPVGLAGLVAYSFAIELVQLELARLDRACDVTDMIDNATGAVLGVLVGTLLALLLRPWRPARGPARGPAGRSRGRGADPSP